MKKRIIISLMGCFLSPGILCAMMSDEQRKELKRHKIGFLYREREEDDKSLAEVTRTKKRVAKANVAKEWVNEETANESIEYIKEFLKKYTYMFDNPEELINRQDAQGDTLLHIIVEKTTNKELENYFIEKLNARTDIKNHEGQTVNQRRTYKALRKLRALRHSF